MTTSVPPSSPAAVVAGPHPPLPGLRPGPPLPPLVPDDRRAAPAAACTFERTEGHWTGDLGINTIVSFGALLLTLLGGFLLTYPDVPAPACCSSPPFGVAILAPILFFPFSKTIWLAIDLQFRPLEPGEVREAVRRW